MKIQSHFDHFKIHSSNNKNSNKNKRNSNISEKEILTIQFSFKSLGGRGGYGPSNPMGELGEHYPPTSALQPSDIKCKIT